MKFTQKVVQGDKACSSYCWVWPESNPPLPKCTTGRMNINLRVGEFSVWGGEGGADNLFYCSAGSVCIAAGLG